MGMHPTDAGRNPGSKRCWEEEKINEERISRGEKQAKPKSSWRQADGAVTRFLRSSD